VPLCQICLAITGQKQLEKVDVETHSILFVETVHVGETIIVRVVTRLVDLCVVPDAIRILVRGQMSACRCHVLARRRCCDCRGIVFIGDETEPISVVVRVLGEVYHLHIDVYARIKQPDGIDVDWNSAAIEAAVRDFVILLLEVVGIYRAIMASIGLPPDAQTVFGRLENWGSMTL
jgi:hypothetical protein